VQVEGWGEPVAIGKKNALNNFCIGVRSNWPGCTSCHADYGWEDESFDFSNQDAVDCLVCHDTTGTYVKGAAGYPLEGMNLATATSTPTFLQLQILWQHRDLKDCSVDDHIRIIANQFLVGFINHHVVLFSGIAVVLQRKAAERVIGFDGMFRKDSRFFRELLLAKFMHIFPIYDLSLLCLTPGL